jgi:WD40 repeat protein
MGFAIVLASHQFGLQVKTAKAQATKQKSSTAKGAASRWKVEADPPAEPIKIPYAAGYSITVKTGEGVELSSPVGNFISLGKNDRDNSIREIYDLRTQKKVGELAGKVFVHHDAKFSQDGQFLLTESAAAPAAANVQTRSIDIYSFKTSSRVQTIVASPTPAFIGQLGFAKGNQPVTARYIGQGDMISVWDIQTGKLAREILGPPSFRREAATISPGGRYLALVSNDSSLIVYDLTTGTKAGELLIPKTDAVYLSPEGLSFSPDGTEIAGLFTGGTESKLLVWDLVKCEIVVDHTLVGNPKLNIPGAQSYKGRAVDWLPDGSAWLLFGHSLVDRAGGRIVWNFQSQPGDFSPDPRMLIDEDHMIITTGPRTARRIEIATLPWKTIDGALKAIEANTPAHVKPGQAVSLVVDVGNLRFGTPAQTREGIIKSLTERLKLEGIPVADGQATVLHIRYGEAAGEVLREYRSNGPMMGFGGTPTGRTVQATKALCSVAWELTGQKKPLWASQLDFDPSSLSIRGDASDAKAREAAFGVLQIRLAGVQFPYFIPKANTVASLPGTSVLGSSTVPKTNKATTKPTTRGRTNR